ncbi:BREX system ATP-binding protein BrxD [Microbacterium esteraromaticum]|uniref:BREX system ATP-binding protein BrxD n=1 Tax=Microbacterium esteraromaticum TaxID=57043 RepID=A0A939ISN2_9MICO|nr:BREX system ATP-binding protein BrxD [Microbacterium esteraromaticum]MBN8207050.1 BREX system ATP-binding protein BrxD [Microbacterium esteraromaticum]MBN8417204.1 BREX system ATP-binding protein BrxD [Microbacterium esteraromaticum]
MTTVSPRRRREIIDALRRGTVPQRGLDVMAVGLERFQVALTDELDTVGGGGAVFKAVRGEYGAGKTFFARWLTETAKQRGFATAEVQISETETPLHRLETIYRRVTENLSTEATAPSAFREVIDEWLRVLEEDVSSSGVDGSEIAQRTEALLERRLAAVSRTAPAFAAALRAYHAATVRGDTESADGLIAWLGGQPHVASAIRRSAGIRGDLDHFGALGFMQGLLAVLRDADYRGLVLVLDEVETLQRVRSDVREKSLNALRQLLDEIDAGRFPGLYVLITGTPAFFEGMQGVQRLPPLAARISVDFSGDPRWDNPRAPQLRLMGFQRDGLIELGKRVRDIYATGSDAAGRLNEQASDEYLSALADVVAGRLGGRVGIAPRVYLRKLVDILDKIEQFPDYVPEEAGTVRVNAGELNDDERAAVRGLDAIDLDV